MINLTRLPCVGLQRHLSLNNFNFTLTLLVGNKMIKLEIADKINTFKKDSILHVTNYDFQK